MEIFDNIEMNGNTIGNVRVNNPTDPKHPVNLEYSAMFVPRELDFNNQVSLNVTHDLGRNPVSLKVILPDGSELECSMNNISNTMFSVHFNSYITGKLVYY
jgi:hypothetical protein